MPKEMKNCTFFFLASRTPYKIVVQPRGNPKSFWITPKDLMQLMEENSHHKQVHLKNQQDKMHL